MSKHRATAVPTGRTGAAVLAGLVVTVLFLLALAVWSITGMANGPAATAGVDEGAALTVLTAPVTAALAITL